MATSATDVNPVEAWKCTLTGKTVVELNLTIH